MPPFSPCHHQNDGQPLLINTQSPEHVCMLQSELDNFRLTGDLYGTQAGEDWPPAWPSGPPPTATVVFAALGAAGALSAITALAATVRHSLVLLNIHLGLLALLMVCLVAAVAAYDNADGESGEVIPDMASSGRRRRHISESTGGGSDSNSVRGDLHDALLEYKWADAVVLSVETLTLLMGCLLHSAYMRADERAEDLEEGLLAGSSAPLLTSSTAEAPAGRDHHRQCLVRHHKTIDVSFLRDQLYCVESLC
ncbi:hypothetical protein VOLCADRAFT_90342 [Volvox carteri f. nagariensis]|uniref:Uncharacterized protein n=1 Tax=Volvox carteri f. nagariensis TaxID=3068 RepID=D8TU43_VOLCA|nr:uncharacterized protein VOLCADRAFT_90342 [Volvox carteri f. nagariensis]EFJ49076.1 hypothetical protein VOLCADRAFT_90342 [Volvox carteri f. nagariensis]|eukprot:XP_002949973.1 hypothetical protein VOLCADRAFT_90342 [Volvox carteri f. nagariensis]